MNDAQPTEHMHQLLANLEQALRDLDAGNLDLDGLDKASKQAQSLYERLVVLRHKAREGHRPTAPSTPLSVVKEPQAISAELPSMRLDTRPSETSPRQTSLIDAIAETETKPAKKAVPAIAEKTPAAPVSEEKPPAQPPISPIPVEVKSFDTGGNTPPRSKPAKPAEKTTPKGPTLADKLEHAPVTDLHKAIALSQKFWFVAELFAGQRERYEKAIDSINGLKTLEDATAFVATEVLSKTGKPPAEDAVKAFSELVERRFK